MYAIIKTGGKQYRVAPGDKLNVEKLAGDVGAEVRLGEVLMTSGDSVEIGAPRVAGASVTARILEQGFGDKVRIFKMKRRKHYRKTQGHRQPYTRLEIVAIGGNGESAGSSAERLGSTSSEGSSTDLSGASTQGAAAPSTAPVADSNAPANG